MAGFGHQAFRHLTHTVSNFDMHGEIDSYARHLPSLGNLIVPLVVTRMECNIVIYATKTDFRMIKVGFETPICCDERQCGLRPDP